MTRTVWDRLEQLAWLAGGGPSASSGSLPIVLVLDPGLPPVPGLVPEPHVADGALWLPWNERAQLLHRSQRAGATTELRTRHPEGDELVAMSLWVADLHLGYLVSHLPEGAAGPWTPASAQRLADGVAAGLAPRLLHAWRAARGGIEASELLALELERLGRPATEVALLGDVVESDGDAHPFRGEVVAEDSHRSFFGTVRGGPHPAGLATIVATGLRRWLTDLPDPDPSTVIDALHADVLEILTHLDVEVEVTVCVPQGRRRVAVATTDAAVVAVDRRGRVVDGVRRTGARLSGGEIGLGRAEELALGGPGMVLAAAGLEDVKLLGKLGAEAVRGATGPLVVAARLRTAMSEQRCPPASTILVHDLP